MTLPLIAVRGADQELAVDHPGDVEAELAVDEVVLSEGGDELADWWGR